MNLHYSAFLYLESILLPRVKDYFSLTGDGFTTVVRLQFYLYLDRFTEELIFQVYKDGKL